MNNESKKNPECDNIKAFIAEVKASAESHRYFCVTCKQTTEHVWNGHKWACSCCGK